MRARWQSSQRPLFVRTVWVDGVRHAILSADDPLFQCRSPTISNSATRPGSCSSVGTFMSSPSGSDRSCDLEPCVINLRLVLSSNKSQTSNTPAATSHRSSSFGSYRDSEPGCVESQDNEENNSLGVASMASMASTVAEYRRPHPPYDLPSSSEEEREQESLEDHPCLFSDVETLLPNLQRNPLSERVLQWLDLVGKNSSIVDGGEYISPVPRFGKGTRKGGPSQRYSSTSTPPSAGPTDKRTLQRQRNVDMSTGTPRTELETRPICVCLQEDSLHVSAEGLKTDRKKRQALEDVRAVIDESVRCASPVADDVCLQLSDSSRPSLQLPSDCVSRPPSLPSPVQLGVSRPQLHIFMPTLRGDRPTIRHQDAADDVSECSSYSSEASS